MDKGKNFIIDSVFSFMVERDKKITIIIALFALGVSIISLILTTLFTINPPIKKPNVELQTNLEGNVLDLSKKTSFDFYIYNGGKAPCYGLQIEYPNFLSLSPLFKEVYEERQSLNSKSNITHPPPEPLTKDHWHYEIKNLDFIYDNEILLFKFYYSLLIEVKDIPNNFYIKAKCMGDKNYEEIEHIRLKNKKAYEPLINMSEIFG